MTNTVLTKTYTGLPWNRKEILRYAGAKGDLSAVDSVLDSCIQEAEGKFTYKVCYREFPVTHTEGRSDLGFMQTVSRDLSRNLQNCDRILLFAATIGIELDRLIAKYSRLSPVKALFFQAIGAERIESLCNAFNSEINDQARKAGSFTRPRFSPGYGDLPLETQKEIFKVLDCPRKIGLSLNESLLMTPSKSVTAIIGMGRAGEKDTEGL